MVAPEAKLPIASPFSTEPVCSLSVWVPVPLKTHRWTIITARTADGAGVDYSAGEGVDKDPGITADRSACLVGDRSSLAEKDPVRPGTLRRDDAGVRDGPSVIYNRDT